ncbi:hypothetical protein L484_022821 [Morus notabilis]|uniref:Uncharacterized protein n=1 Tax=Morus notabilis TaxID=981085 RepID=W9SD69_9ROSA|nr:hypothetical protein L484_022821 [Morus notabilis]
MPEHGQLSYPSYIHDNETNQRHPRGEIEYPLSVPPLQPVKTPLNRLNYSDGISLYGRNMKSTTARARHSAMKG